MTDEQMQAMKAAEADNGPRAQVALLLYNTYRVMCGEQREQRKFEAADVVIAGHRVRTVRHVRDFSKTKAARRAAVVDNIEDNPIEPVTRKKSLEDAKTPLNFWHRLADFTITNHYDAEGYIRAQFTSIGEGADSPAPTALMNPRAVKNYLDAQRINAREVRVTFHTQKQTYQTHIVTESNDPFYKGDGPTIWAAVLDDAQVRLSDLFRHCMGLQLAVDPKVCDPDVFVVLAEKYRRGAALQYVVMADAYDAVYRDWIPTGFRAMAEQVYRVHYAAADIVTVPAAGRKR